MEPFRLPKGFLLGSATAATQIEGGDRNNNWYYWSEQGKIKDRSSTVRAIDHWNRYEEDIEILKKLNNKVYRMGIEWSRVEPENGRFDKSAIEHYRKELSLLNKNGIKPLVTLHHFTHPLWLCREGDFENRRIVYYFERYVRYVVENIGDLVSEYITINEPNVYVSNGYFTGQWPPGKRNIILGARVFRNMARCHIAAYKAIHEIRRANGCPGRTMVGVANHLRLFVPYCRFNPFDMLAARVMDYILQDAMVKLMAKGRLNLPFWHFAPKRSGKFYDFIGINYYSRSAVRFWRFKDELRAGMPKNDLGWEICPEGMEKLCLRFYKKYRAPIWITENGTCDNSDAYRAKFIYDHLLSITKAVSSGAKVERYYHWSLFDNFEWLEGEKARFGLVHVDFDTQERAVKQSGRFYAEICRSNGVTREMIGRYLEKNTQQGGGFKCG